MSAARDVCVGVWLCVTLVGCATDTTSTAPVAPVQSLPAASVGADVSSSAPVGDATAVPVLSVEAARTVALSWVASTGALLSMGRIARAELIREHVAVASAETMAANLDADLAKLADGLPIPATELRLVETPLTIDIAIDSVSGRARAQVWSVVVFGAKDLGAPRVVFRTSQLVLVPDNAGWKLAGFTSTQGPTPIATDSLPADWDAFAVVADWQPASEGGL